MWVLIVVAFSGGASSNISHVEFSSKARCDVAAKTLNGLVGEVKKAYCFQK
jgi:hypothetical protein